MSHETAWTFPLPEQPCTYGTLLHCSVPSGFPVAGQTWAVPASTELWWPICIYSQSVIHLIEYMGTSSHNVTTQGNRTGLWTKEITSSLLLLFIYLMIINYMSIKGLHSLQAWAHQPSQWPKEVKNQEIADLLMNAADLSFRHPVIFFSLPCWAAAHFLLGAPCYL